MMTHTLNHIMPRRAGILLHPTSLPGPFGVGSLGAGARSFVDFLTMAKVSLWQVLPLVPTGDGGSPYSSWSAFAGNPDLIDIPDLAELGLLDACDIATPPEFDCNSVDYAAARAARRPLLQRAFDRLVERKDALREEFEAFKRAQPWSLDTGQFAAIKNHHQQTPWWEWPAALRDRERKALNAITAELAREVERHVAAQFLFAKQWAALRDYAATRGVGLVGDLPIYVDADSVDVWASRGLFELDATGKPARVAGVPPDAFSATGQRWGNPLYRWDRMAEENFAWWCARLRRSFEHTDWVRIDHFRGLSAYWAVPASAPDARTGEWVKGPGIAFFAAAQKSLGTLPIIAEDLGVIDDEVRGLLAQSDLAGMRVLHFAFEDNASNPYLPHNYLPKTVVYTGTHDNDTTVGWWNAQPHHVRQHVKRYLNTSCEDIAWDLMRAAFASVALFAVVPMQDVLSLGSNARMNTPAVAAGNWRWRCRNTDLQPDIAHRLRELVELYGRRGS